MALPRAVGTLQLRVELLLLAVALLQHKPKSSSIVEWTKKTWSVCFEESYPATKKEIVSCRKTDGIMIIVLSELSQAQKNK